MCHIGSTNVKEGAITDDGTHGPCVETRGGSVYTTSDNVVSASARALAKDF